MVDNEKQLWTHNINRREEYKTTKHIVHEDKMASMIQAKIYIKSKLYQLVGTYSYPWVKTIVTLILAPIPIFVLFIFLIETTTENIFFFVLWATTFYLLVFTLLMAFIKAADGREARSPFYFIKNLHTTGGSDPISNQLIGAEIGVASGVNAESILKS